MVMTRVLIDPNVRVRGQQTYAGFEDIDGPVAAGQEVEVYETESGATGSGRMVDIDFRKRLVCLEVDWATFGVAS
jgi:hypothetical protein